MASPPLVTRRRPAAINAGSALRCPFVTNGGPQREGERERKGPNGEKRQERRGIGLSSCFLTPPSLPPSSLYVAAGKSTCTPQNSDTHPRTYVHSSSPEIRPGKKRDPARNRKGGRAESREEEGREKKEKVPLFHLVDKEKSRGGKGEGGKRLRKGGGDIQELICL